jgi:hypothetical protein
MRIWILPCRANTLDVFVVEYVNLTYRMLEYRFLFVLSYAHQLSYHFSCTGLLDQVTPPSRVSTTSLHAQFRPIHGATSARYHSISCNAFDNSQSEPWDRYMPRSSFLRTCVTPLDMIDEDVLSLLDAMQPVNYRASPDLHRRTRWQGMEASHKSGRRRFCMQI